MVLSFQNTYYVVAKITGCKIIDIQIKDWINSTLNYVVIGLINDFILLYVTYNTVVPKRF